MLSDISNKNNFCLRTLVFTIRTQNNHFMLFLTISLIFHMIIYTAKCTSPTIPLKHNFIALAYPLLEFNVHINQYFFNCSILRCYFEDVHTSCTSSSGQWIEVGWETSVAHGLGVSAQGSVQQKCGTCRSFALPLENIQLFQTEALGSTGGLGFILVLRLCSNIFFTP